MKVLDRQISVCQQPYKRIDYATLQTRNLDHVLDTMRYERAFFATERDVAPFLSAAADWNNFYKSAEITLARFSWPKNKWTHARMLSGQAIIEKLNWTVQVNKVQIEIKVADTLVSILKLMVQHRMFPAHEGDSYTLEQAIHRPNEIIEVSLGTFVHSNVEAQLLGIR